MQTLERRVLRGDSKRRSTSRANGTFVVVEIDPIVRIFSNLLVQPNKPHHQIHHRNSLQVRNSFPRATDVMRKSVITMTFALISLFSLVFFISHFRLSELDITHNTVPQTRPIESLNNKTNGVIIVTAVSYEKLVDFEGVDGFYQKMWDNRMSFAE